MKFLIGFYIPRGAVIDTKNAVLSVLGGGVGEVIEVKLGAGNFTFDEKRNMDYIKDRGLLDTVREGDEEPMDVRLDALWDFLTGTTGVITVEDAMKKRGDASDWTSTSADPCEPYAVDLKLVHTPPCGGDQAETILIPDFRHESIAHDLRGGTLAFTGKSNAKEATVTRGAVGT